MTQPIIFISYSHKDEAWKDRLVTQLQVLAKEGIFDVWDDRRIVPGDEWQPEIEKSMEAAALAILLVSADFLTSPFIRGEEIPRLMQRRIEQGLRIYPILVRSCPWPAVDWLARLQMRPTDGKALASFRGNKVEEILSHIALEIATLLKPSSRPLPTSPSHSPSPPRLFHGVPSLPGHFTGRDDLLADLAKRLTGGATGLALSAEGLPGVGKTTLAVALAHSPAIWDYFTDGVLWAGLGPQPDVMSALAAWADALGGDISHLPSEAARAQAVKDAIGPRRMLLVIDDAWDKNAALWLRCGGPNCAHLLTTRDQGIARAFAGAGRVAHVPTLADDPAFNLLQTLAPEACAADPAAAQKLARTVGGLPLALELLGGYLAAPERTYFPDLSAAALAELGDPQRRLQLARQRLGSYETAPQTLQEAITLSLTGLPDEAGRAFYAMGAFAPKPDTFDRPAAEAVTGASAAVLALLAARNLLEITGEQLSLHQTLADVARTNLPPEAVTRHRDYYLALANEDPQDWRRIEAVYPQLKWAWAIVADEDEARMDFIWVLRTYQERRGLWPDQLAWFNAGLILVQRLGQRENEGTLLHETGNVYNRIGKRDKALDFYQQALSIYEEIKNQAYQAASLVGIGLVYGNLGQRQEALSYYQRALPIFEEVNDRVGLAVTLNNIGAVYVSLGQPQEALSYYQRALPIREEVGDRAGVAQTLNNIGLVHDNLGQRQEALSYYQRAVPIWEEVGDRAGLSVTLSNIGTIYHNLGQRQEASNYFQRALPIQEEVGDRGGESTTRWWLGLLYQGEGNLAEAVAQLRRAVELAVQVQSPYLERIKTELAQVEGEVGERGEEE